MRLSTLSVVALACTLTLGACGGDDDSKEDKKAAQPEVKVSTHPGLDADKKVRLNKMCAALGDQEVSEALGAEVHRGATAKNNCMFTDLADLLPTATITYQKLALVGGLPGVKRDLTGGDEEPEAIDGVGDDAYIAVSEEGDKGPVAHAAVVLGKTFLHVQVNLAPDASADDTKAAARALVDRIDARLPESKGSSGS